MTLLQRLSRSARNGLLLCPRSLRLGGRRRGFNIAFFTLFFITFTFYLSERTAERIQAPVETIKLEKRANVLEQVTSTSTLLLTKSKTEKEPREISRITRMTVPAPEEQDDSKYSQDPTTASKVNIIPLKNCTKRSAKLVGDMKSNPNITPTMEEVAEHVGPNVQMGGCFSPANCKALQKVAIIIPFKDRDAHLKTLLYYLHPMLMRQQLHYCIYVAEQYDNGQFNKAAVMNAAFEEAVKLDDYDCIIFHDVDMIPENDRNFYMCGTQPRHLSPAIDKFQYKPHYGTDFGGVTGISPAQYRKANGHSNRFWGWGGEDNDMEYRIRYRNMSIIPSSLNTGRYKMIPHLHPWKFSPNKFPWKLNNTRKGRAKTDGLSDLQYHLVDTIRHPLYTKLMIDIRRIEVTKLTLYIDGKSTMDIDLYPDEIDPEKCRWETYPNLTLEKHDRIDDEHHVYSNLTSALESCENMLALCGGVVKEVGGTEFTLRKKGPPKHSDQELMRLLLGNRNVRLYGALGNDLRLAWVKLRKQAATGDFTLNRRGKKQLRTDTHVVLDPEDQLSSSGIYEVPTLEEVLSKNTTAYVKYCPGFYGAHQAVPIYLKQAINENISKWLEDYDGKNSRHFFAFKLDIKVLMKPTEYLYYTDNKHFESHLEKGENHYTFMWPGSKAPNFTDKNVPRKYSFRTPDFAIPNIPGTYAVESKIIDRHSQPYFQWNWWFEVTSGDRQLDAQTRDAYWKKKMTENIMKTKAQQHAEMMKQRAAKAKKNEELYQRKMKELKKKPSKPMPPQIQSIVNQVQKAFDKRENEGDPVAELIDPHAPIFQKYVGQIRVAEDQPEPEKKPSSTKTTTTTKHLVKLPTIRSKFHIGAPKVAKKNSVVA